MLGLDLARVEERENRDVLESWSASPLNTRFTGTFQTLIITVLDFTALFYVLVEHRSVVFVLCTVPEHRSVITKSYRTISFFCHRLFLTRTMSDKCIDSCVPGVAKQGLGQARKEMKLEHQGNEVKGHAPKSC